MKFPPRFFMYQISPGRRRTYGVPASLLILFSLLVCNFLSGCSAKGITKPRSEVLEDAESQGRSMYTVAQDRERFFESDKKHNTRLLHLLRRRSQGMSAGSEYRIGPGDEIEINVFDVPELNVTAKVKESGYLNLPLIGAVRASGLTDADLQSALAQRLRTFVRNPEITIFVSNYGSQKVAVMGAVRNPGTYALKKGANSLVEVINEAGGVNDKAGNIVNFVPAEMSGMGASNEIEARARLALQSQDDGNLKNSGIEVYLDQMMGTSGGMPIEIPARGGDMIVIPEAGKIMVEGEVGKIGSYDLGRNMTLLGALAASGGITYGAKIDEVEVIREIGGDRVHLVVDLEAISRGEEKDVRLRNGDIVRVPSDRGRRLGQDTFDGITKLINFGVGGSVNLGP